MPKLDLFGPVAGLLFSRSRLEWFPCKQKGCFKKDESRQSYPFWCNQTQSHPLITLLIGKVLKSSTFIQVWTGGFEFRYETHRIGKGKYRRGCPFPVLWPRYRPCMPNSRLGIPVRERVTNYVTLTCRWYFTKYALLLLFIAQLHKVGISIIGFSVTLSKLSRLQIAALTDTAFFSS